jgi:hypothetical protein
MKTVNFEEKLVKINSTAEEAIRIAEANKVFETERLNALRNVLPLVEKWVVKNNLQIEDIRYGKQGPDANWTAESKYSVSCNLTPANDKFKFIQFAGYTKRGAGKNQDRLYAKAAKLEESFLAATGIKCDINPFSLESQRKQDGNKMVLVSFQI